MQMLTARDVAEMLKISYEQSLRLMRHPDLKSKKIGRQYRVSDKALEAFLERNDEVDLSGFFR